MAKSTKSTVEKYSFVNAKEVNLPYEIERSLQTLLNYYVWQMFPKRINAYKKYFMYKQDRQQEIQDWQTNMQLPITKMFVDWLWKGIYDNNLTFRVAWRTENDHKRAESIRKYIERGFSTSDSRVDLMDIGKEALITGIGNGKAWFVNRKSVINYRKWGEKKTKDIIEQYPFLDYVSIFDLYRDFSVNEASESRLAVRRKIMHIKDIEKKYSSFDENIGKKAIEALKKSTYFHQYDFNRVKHPIFWDNLPENLLDVIGDQRTQDYMDVIMKNYLSLDLKDRYGEVIEYWTDDQLFILVNLQVVYQGENPLPFKKIPFVSVTYNKIPGTMAWQGVATSTADIQEISNTLLNLSVDNIKLNIAPMLQKMRGSDILAWSDRLEYEPFKVIETTDPNGLQRIPLGTSDFSAIQLIQFLLQIGEMSEWVNSYALWYQQKVERSATWVSALLQAYKSSLLPFVDSLNRALGQIAKMRTLFAISETDGEISMRIYDDKEEAYTFMSIEPEDLLAEFDVYFDMQALKAATREVRRNQLLQVLQTAVQAGVDPITGQFILDLRPLWKEILTEFEFDKGLIIDANKAVRTQSRVQRQIAKEEMKTQQQMQQAQSQVQPSQPLDGSLPTDAPVELPIGETSESRVTQDVPLEEISPILKAALEQQ
jgi:hypothetical protein